MRFASEAELHDFERLDDEHRLAMRQRQIDFGKNTAGYDRYFALIPKYHRYHQGSPVCGLDK